MARKDLVELLRRIGERRANIAEWETKRKTLEKIDLAKADLANLDLADITLKGADLAGANLFNTNLSGADLSDSSLAYADLRRANLANAFLCGANLSAANLQGANLVDTNLQGALMQGTRLGGAYLVGAILSGAEMRSVDLRGTNCKFANFTGAILRDVNVEDADLTQVDLTEEQRQGLINIEQAIIQRGKIAGKTAKRRIAPSESYDDLFTETDCYTILGIKPGASPEEITHAYRKKVKEYHPDRVAHLGVKLQEVARREFERIQHAYEVLSRRMAKPYLDVGGGAGAAAEDPLALRPPEALSLEEYQQLAKRYPYNDRIIYNLGVKYFEAGWVQLAAEAFEKTLALNPNNSYARHNLKVINLLRQLIA